MNETLQTVVDDLNRMLRAERYTPIIHPFNRGFVSSEIFGSLIMDQDGGVSLEWVSESQFGEFLTELDDSGDGIVDPDADDPETALILLEECEVESDDDDKVKAEVEDRYSAMAKAAEVEIAKRSAKPAKVRSIEVKADEVEADFEKGDVKVGRSTKSCVNSRGTNHRVFSHDGYRIHRSDKAGGHEDRFVKSNGGQKDSYRGRRGTKNLKVIRRLDHPKNIDGCSYMDEPRVVTQMTEVELRRHRCDVWLDKMDWLDGSEMDEVELEAEELVVELEDEMANEREEDYRMYLEEVEEAAYWEFDDLERLYRVGHYEPIEEYNDNLDDYYDFYPEPEVRMEEVEVDEVADDEIGKIIPVTLPKYGRRGRSRRWSQHHSPKARGWVRDRDQVLRQSRRLCCRHFWINNPEMSDDEIDGEIKKLLEDFRDAMADAV